MEESKPKTETQVYARYKILSAGIYGFQSRGNGQFGRIVKSVERKGVNIRVSIWLRVTIYIYIYILYKYIYVLYIYIYIYIYIHTFVWLNRNYNSSNLLLPIQLWKS